jgi:3-oxoacyl-[acyl-carrier protein] reductase
MVRTLARCGADVAIHYHANRELADQLQAEVVAMGRRALVAQADVGDRDSVFAMRDEVVSGLGATDIIVNNAVASYGWTSVLEQAVEDYEGQFRSSVLHNVLMAQAFVPGMISGGKGGRVIGINTECSMQTFPSQSAYVAGKRGMDGVLRVLAREVGPHGITVNQVAPGWTISDRARARPDDDADYISKVPLRRRGTDQEIANVVAFLASDLAGYVTGVYIPVCGGNVMPGI